MIGGKAGLTSSPTQSNAVRLAVRRANRLRASRPHQKKGLTHDIRARILSACPDTLAGLRDAAIISVGYDTLGRASLVRAPAATNGAARLDHTFEYKTGATLLHVAGASEPFGHSKKVEYDSLLRTVKETDVANLAVTTE